MTKKVKVLPGQMVTKGLLDKPVIKIENRIKKVPLVKVDKFLKPGDNTFESVYFNPATTNFIGIKENDNVLIIKDEVGVWIFPNTQRVKKMLAMFFDYIDPEKLMDEEKEQEE